MKDYDWKRIGIAACGCLLMLTALAPAQPGGPGPEEGAADREFQPPKPPGDHGPAMRRRGEDRRKGPGRGQRGFGKRWGRGFGFQLSEKQIQEMLDFLAKYMPKMHNHLMQEKKANPERFRRMVRRAWPEYLRRLELKRRDPELFELKMKDDQLGLKTLELVRQYRTARGDGREKIHAELKGVVAEHFRVRQARRQKELENLKKRVVEIETELADRQSNAEKIQQERLGQLLKKTRRPKW